ncbi:hypothetical protein [Natrinema halophilum]|uniref:hypothetical protein n=1 Tax=Natrinema halophilum TaxID=1699371 RepID=UPI001F436728|nr:hypothetical protein [Natrinema halophilum]UHQ96220.1 hypothetical protein HYG82_23250 [Natrinema halophilum]
MRTPSPISAIFNQHRAWGRNGTRTDQGTLVLSPGEKLVESGEIERVEVIDHHPDVECIRVVVICEFNHPVDSLFGASSVCDLDVNPASQRFRRKVEFLFTIAFVVSVDTSDRSRFRREWVAFMPMEGFTGLGETDDWTTLIVQFLVELKNILHVVDKFSVLVRRSHPIVREMQF